MFIENSIIFTAHLQVYIYLISFKHALLETFLSFSMLIFIKTAAMSIKEASYLTHLKNPSDAFGCKRWINNWGKKMIIWKKEEFFFNITQIDQYLSSHTNIHHIFVMCLWSWGLQWVNLNTRVLSVCLVLTRWLEAKFHYFHLAWGFFFSLLFLSNLLFSSSSSVAVIKK